MKRLWIRIGILLFIAGAGGVAALLLNADVLNLENVREHRAHLLLFVRNHYYSAARTKIPLKTFAWTTLVGMLPGSLIHAFMGEQLRYVEAASDLLSGKVMFALALLALFALIPVILKKQIKVK